MQESAAEAFFLGRLFSFEGACAALAFPSHPFPLSFPDAPGLLSRSARSAFSAAHPSYDSPDFTPPNGFVFLTVHCPSVVPPLPSCGLASSTLLLAVLSTPPCFRPCFRLLLLIWTTCVVFPRESISSSSLSRARSLFLPPPFSCPFPPPARHESQRDVAWPRGRHLLSRHAL